MRLLLALWALSGTPTLVAPLTVQQPDGRWKCTGFCLTSGNDDGGSCRTALVSRDKATEAACKADLNEQCTKVKPPPGGCRWAGNPPAAK